MCPRSPDSFYWRMVFRNQEAGARCALSFERKETEKVKNVMFNCTKSYGSREDRMSASPKESHQLIKWYLKLSKVFQMEVKFWEVERGEWEEMCVSN